MENNTFAFAGERFADLQMLRYRLNGFEQLSLQQKKYIYYLSKATLTGRDITTDQFGKYNLPIRKLLENLYLHFAGDRESKDFLAMTVYLKRVWFSNGIYHHYGCEKFQPDFSESWLRKAVDDTPFEVLPGSFGSKQEMMDVLCPVIFDPDVLPKRVNQADGEDLVKTSACNYYDGVTQQEAEQYYEHLRQQNGGNEQPSFGLNSKLVKKDGELVEVRYTADGLYGEAIRKIVYWLDKAREVAENEQQRRVIALLTDYYRTGDLKLFDEYSIEWLRENEGDVDFINGFIEVYGDPLGLKGSWEGIVEYKDEAR